MHIEITKQAVHGSERFELHLGGGIYIFSLKRGEKLAGNILSLLGIDVAQLEERVRELEALAKTVRVFKDFEWGFREDENTAGALYTWGNVLAALAALGADNET